MSILHNIDDILHTAAGSSLTTKAKHFIDGAKSGFNPLSWGNKIHTNEELLGPKLGEKTSGHAKYTEIANDNPNRMQSHVLSHSEYSDYEKHITNPHNLGVKVGGTGLATTTLTGTSNLQQASKPPEAISHISKKIETTSRDDPLAIGGVAVGSYGLYKYLKKRKKDAS